MSTPESSLAGADFVLSMPPTIFCRTKLRISVIVSKFRKYRFIMCGFFTSNKSLTFPEKNDTIVVYWISMHFLHIDNREI